MRADTRDKDKHAARGAAALFEPGQSWSYEEAFADGCAHRDAQLLAFLGRLRGKLATTAVARRSQIDRILSAIIRGEHAK